MEFIEIAWHFASVSRYLDATRGFIENLDQHLERLDDGLGKCMEFELCTEILSKIPIYVLIPNRHGNSALKIALSRKKLDLARALIPLDESDISAKSGSMRSSLQLAISKDDVEVLTLKQLKNRKLSVSMLISDCAGMGSDKQLKYLMTTSIPQLNFDSIDFQRKWQRDDVSRIYELLLRNGMDPNIQLNAKGKVQFSLQIARLSRNWEIENTLIRSGAEN
ncbi:hypothetical protein HK098_000927 [Nowakowskiella sp. JEL0407]|nr:hypothetical protein HK098_000927 [Nowakowskiella sp. JEL0407]